VWPAEKLRVTDCIGDCIRLAVPQATEWQRIGNQINAAFIGSRSHFVNVDFLLPGENTGTNMPRAYVSLKHEDV